jgi:anti-anti-sigma regulatory factor
LKRPGQPFLVARSQGALYVRVQGLGSMHTAPTLEAFAEAQIQEGAHQLVLDLQECSGVDSTFMGLLLTLANRLREGQNGGPGGCVLINVDAHARKQLASVGVDAFVVIKEGETELPENLRLTELAVAEASDRERLKLMVRAHKELVAADARNKAKFGAFLEGIVAELGE